MFGKVGYEYSTDKNVVGKMSKLNPKQEALRNAWLYHSK
jgi:hypothetical protein